MNLRTHSDRRIRDHDFDRRQNHSRNRNSAYSQQSQGNHTITMRNLFPAARQSLMAQVDARKR